MSDFSDELSRVLRYEAEEHPHAPFHRLLRDSAGVTYATDHSGKNVAAHGAYADFLADNGMPATGEAISQGMVRGEGAVWHNTDRRAGGFLPLKDAFVVSWTPDSGFGRGVDTLHLYGRDQTDHDGNAHFLWELPVPAGTGLELVRRMVAEGVVPTASTEKALAKKRKGKK